jgi:hypothetical protein
MGFLAAWWLLRRLAPPALAAEGGVSLAADGTVAVPGPTVGRLGRRTVAAAGSLRTAVLLGIVGLLGLEIWAARTDYGLRVTSDTPTFLALLRDMTVSPFSQVSPFLAGSGVQTSHATPYMQAIAWLWHQLVAAPDAHGTPFSGPVSAYRLLSAVGLFVTVIVLHACFIWVRKQAGSRAAWISLPVLLTLFGPAHVIWAGDLTFHGFLYASFYPQTLALGLLLYSLVLVDSPLRLPRLAAAVVLVAATTTVHPFTGVLLAFLLSIAGATRALDDQPGWQVPSIALVGGYLLARLWPAYSLDQAMTVGGLSGRTIVVGCACLPFALRLVAPGRILAWARSALEKALDSARLASSAPKLLAGVGLATVLVLAAWQAWILHQPFPDPLVHSNRLAVYWVENRWRWPLMLGAGAVGLVGLARLARNGRPLPGLWFASCLGVGVAGIAGLPLPVWWRFLLFCQLPLALGVSELLANAQVPGKRIVTVTFAFALGFKLVTLLALPNRLTYFNSPLQEAYSLGSVIPPASSGLVATDPFTAYYIPGATGHQVLSVTKAHVGSQRELAASERGYRLLHQYYMGATWWQAAQTMWSRGVRYVVVEKHTSLAPPTLEEFSTGPTPLIRTYADRRRLGAYFYRNNRVGTLVYDSPTYAIYRLVRQKLCPGSQAC